MGGLFSRTEKKQAPEPVQGSPGRRQPQISSYDRCILQLKLNRDKLNAACALYERRADAERETAKKLLVAGHKDKALYCLKRRRAQEVHLQRVQRHLDNVFTMLNSVESKQMDNEVAAALKQGSDELAVLNAHLSLNDIEQIMANASEQIQITTEASELLAQNLTTEDDDLFEKELESLMGTRPLTTAQNQKGGSATVAALHVPQGIIGGRQDVKTDEEYAGNVMAPTPA